MKKFKNTIIIFFVSVNILYCAFKEPGWTARATGMGGAFTSISDDTNGVLYNPAGTSEIKNVEGSFMYSKLYTGLDEVNLGLNYLSLIFPYEKDGVVGVSWANFNSENYSENTGVITFAKKLDRYFKLKYISNFTVGFNIKYLQHSYSLDLRTRMDPLFVKSNKKDAFTMDLGLKTAVNEQLLFGVSFKNITQPDVGLTTKDIVPLEYKLGFGFKHKGFMIPFDKKALVIKNTIFALDVSYRTQNWGKEEDKITFAGGVEGWFLDEVLGLRCGANSTEGAFGCSIKFPVKLLDLQLDYSFIWPIYIVETTGSHRIQLVCRLGEIKKKKVVYEKPKIEERPVAFGPEILLEVKSKFEIDTKKEPPEYVKFRVFCDDIKGVDIWELDILNSQEEVVKNFKGVGKVNRIILWDVKDKNGNYIKEGKYKAKLMCKNKVGEVSSTEKEFELSYKVYIEKPKEVIIKEIIKEVPKEIRITEEEKYIRVNLQASVLFETAKYELLEASKKILYNIIELLKKYPENKIIVEGHTDSVGSDEYNMKLSLNRALAVKNFLVENGIEEKRIEVKAYGKTKPIASNKTASGRALNRRVEILILK